jgi:hypothetical protein
VLGTAEAFSPSTIDAVHRLLNSGFALLHKMRGQIWVLTLVVHKVVSRQ